MAHANLKRVVGAALIATVIAGTAGCSMLFPEQVTRDAESQEVTEAGNADVFTLRVGDCFDDVTETEISDVPAVPCSESHDNEVYYSFEMPEGEWPGDDAITAAADEQCTAQFDAFVGLSYDESTLDWYPITPLEEGWTSAADREILCAVWDPAGKVSGSLAGAAY